MDTYTIDHVYVLEVVDECGDDSNHFIHDTEESAIFAAIDEMNNWFKNNDFDDPSNVKEHEIYTRIKELVDNGNYYCAIDEFDNIEDNGTLNLNESLIFISIYRKKVFHKHVNNGIGKPEQISGKKEIPCPHCGKMNDVDATHCWSLHCGRPLKY